MLSRLLGWAIIGWAVPWPALLPALLSFHIALTLLSWVIETSCDLGGAAEIGPGSMLAALKYVRLIEEQVNKDRSHAERYNRALLLWVAGPFHPPLPLRQALIGIRWPQASAQDGR